MEKEFVPYEQALALKELGFDEPCIAFYSPKKELYPVMQQPGKGPYFNNGNFIETIRAPLYQQAFMFFREKYKLNSTLLPIENKWYFLISKTGETLTLNRPRQCYRDTYEEAELECLKKLIESICM